jgi:hypothetical protein
MLLIIFFCHQQEYIKYSQIRKQKFVECAQMFNINVKKGLCQDVTTRWNSTYLMIDSILPYREALGEYTIHDRDYNDCPENEEWVEVEKVHKFLKIFYDATNILSGTSYTTSNCTFMWFGRFNML